ncbi:hypothetical protein [Gulosibacter molinativorax]|uniref:YtxH domain-containing protein n=1 Tax=Gulosibacter molinativorax TaxID=256821 RepID=A0ABT7C7F1_9MICO|nr:hypothetical protein [Gulosibacter molinativorax]MDJ1371053.1 hypothetical protein [Gulosibacter molinativorax]QUY61413.1 Hypotetical protein [Gulosibacter molinativorax]
MRNFLRSAALVGGGIVAGFTLAHFVNSTEKGREFFGQVNARIDDVKEAVQQGYRARTEAIYAAIEKNQ